MTKRPLLNQHKGANRRRAHAHVYKHPPPKRIYGNVATQFMELRGSWNFKHPPPICQADLAHQKRDILYDYPRVNRKAQRAALECQRSSTEVRDALHHCI